MRLRSLNLLLDAVLGMAHPKRVVILGSSSLLATAPSLGEPGQPLETSDDADLLVQPVDDELAAILDEAVGPQSLFARRNGCHSPSVFDRELTRRD